MDRASYEKVCIEDPAFPVWISVSNVPLLPRDPCRWLDCEAEFTPRVLPVTEETPWVQFRS